MVEFVFWDVQHGSAAYIRTPNGKHMVVDLGTGSYRSSSTEFSPLLHLKDKYAVKQLDAVIITHPHRDHLDDIVNFDRLSPTVLCRPSGLAEKDILAGNRTGDKDILNMYLEIHERYRRPIDPSESPFSPSNNGGLEIETFKANACTASELNNHSIVTVIRYCHSKMLIPGDNECASWNELLRNRDFVSSIEGTDVLVASHHGRESGFSPDLLKYISPRLTVISDGRFCDTSATGRYSCHSQGCTVSRRKDSTTPTRRCVTTRNDGVIVVKFGEAKGDISVTID